MQINICRSLGLQYGHTCRCNCTKLRIRFQSKIPIKIKIKINDVWPIQFQWCHDKKIHSTIDQKKNKNEINHQHMYKNVQTEIHHSTSSKLKKKLSLVWNLIDKCWLECTCIIFPLHVLVTIWKCFTVNLGWSGFG